MRKPRALDLFCGAGGISVGLARAGFDVVGVDSNPKVEPYWRKGMEPYGGEFYCVNALDYLDQLISAAPRHLAERRATAPAFDLICASPPCQAHTVLRRLNPGREYPDLIPATRERLQAAGIPWCIENVPGAPLGGANLIMLCGTMFGLQTPDGRAELRRHRLFETSFGIPLRPACQHGHVSADALSVAGHVAEISRPGWHRSGSVITVSGDRCNSANTPKKMLCVAGSASPADIERAEEKRAGRSTISITGAVPQSNTITNKVRETFSIDDARAAMQIDWMPMRFLSQAIPPAYSFWLGKQALAAIRFEILKTEAEP